MTGWASRDDNEPPNDVLPMRVVALGGGHGLAASLGALREVVADVVAVVTVADDGGSSGRIREQLPVLPPGDLRMALAALAARDDRDWTEAFQHRIGGDGSLAGHPVGNLLLTGLMDHLGDPLAALDLVGRMLGVRGRVLPMSVQPLRLTADVRAPDGALAHVVGQHAVAVHPGHVERVGLLPPDARACPEALAAIATADAIVLGPGSWYSSVIPHLLLPELRDALSAAPGRVVVTLNLVQQEGETDGFSPQEHLRVMRDYAPHLRIDTVLAETRAVPDAEALELAVAQCGATLALAPVADPLDQARHERNALAAAYRAVLSSAGPHAGAVAADADSRGHVWP